MINKICIICGKNFIVFPCRSFSIHCSAKCRYIHDKTLKKKEGNPMWKGDKVGYKGIHFWLRINYGKANKCENPKCLHKSKTFNWALKKDFPYSHNVNNFIQFCRGCHTTYDKDKDTNKKISETLKGHPSWNNWQSIKRNKNGRFVST